MSMFRRIVARAGWLAGAVGSLAAAQAPAAAPTARPTFSALYAFDGESGGLGTSVIPSGSGYVGTLTGGGAFGAGMVYKLAADGSETTLYNFTGGADGANPYGVIADAQGNLYGVTEDGGNQGCSEGFSCGVIYKVTPNGQQTVLYAFPASMTMGWWPTGQLTRDADGNLYGATVSGGDTTCEDGEGCGVVFKLAPDGSYTVLYAFTGGDDGLFPNGSLLRDRAGNLYGTTLDTASRSPGTCQTVADVGCGTVFRIAPDGSYARLHVFGVAANGLTPTAGLTGDAAGNLYGTTSNGGVNPGNVCRAVSAHREGCGVVYKLAPGGAYSVLYAFQGGSDGISPAGGLYRNPQGGGLYGAASTLSPFGRYCQHYRNCALVFVVMPDGSKRPVYNFASGNGLVPTTPLVRGQGDQLVGVAYQNDNLTATIYSLQFKGGQ